MRSHPLPIAPTLALALALVLLPFAPARAQDATANDKLRDLLRQTTVQLRAAEDANATLQASLDTMTKQRDQLQAQLAAAPPKPAAPEIAPAQLQQTQAALAAARAQNAALASNAASIRKSYDQASAIARDKDASDQRHAAALKLTGAQLETCKTTNSKLIDLSGEILHLYETPQFERLLVSNHERLLGFKRVQLQNLVQDYDDRIAAQSYLAPTQTK